VHAAFEQQGENRQESEEWNHPRHLVAEDRERPGWIGDPQALDHLSLRQRRLDGIEQLGDDPRLVAARRQASAAAVDGDLFRARRATLLDFDRVAAGAFGVHPPHDLRERRNPDIGSLGAQARRQAQRHRRAGRRRRGQARFEHERLAGTKGAVAVERLQLSDDQHQRHGNAQHRHERATYVAQILPQDVGLRPEHRARILVEESQLE
jgi:hypothetical protein